MKPWTAWSDEAIKRRQPDALAEYRTRLADKLEYHRVTQFLFDEQWHALKNMPMTTSFKLLVICQFMWQQTA